ncbi:MAG: DUF5667 domain-containing protein [Patescibacteria group bacterium]
MIFLKAKLARWRKASRPDPVFKQALLERLAVLEAELRPVQTRTYAPSLRFAFASLVLVVGSFVGLSTYAYSAPAVSEGNVLYPVKRALEEVQGDFKHTPESHAKFRAKQLERRVKELNHQLKREQTLTPEMVVALTESLNIAVTEFKALKNDEVGKTLIKTRLKHQILLALESVRNRIAASDLPEPDKSEYLRAMNLRLDRLQDTPTAAP